MSAYLGGLSLSNLTLENLEKTDDAHRKFLQQECQRTQNEIAYLASLDQEQRRKDVLVRLLFLLLLLLLLLLLFLLLTFGVLMLLSNLRS